MSFMGARSLADPDLEKRGLSGLERPTVYHEISAVTADISW
jgi:hypothetical protein